eukprot:gene4813-3455_t
MCSPSHRHRHPLASTGVLWRGSSCDPCDPRQAVEASPLQHICTACSYLCSDIAVVRLTLHHRLVMPPKNAAQTQKVPRKNDRNDRKKEPKTEEAPAASAPMALHASHVKAAAPVTQEAAAPPESSTPMKTPTPQRTPAAAPAAEREPAPVEAAPAVQHQEPATSQFNWADDEYTTYSAPQPQEVPPQEAEPEAAAEAEEPQADPEPQFAVQYPEAVLNNRANVVASAIEVLRQERQRLEEERRVFERTTESREEELRKKEADLSSREQQLRSEKEHLNAESQQLAQLKAQLNQQRQEQQAQAQQAQAQQQVQAQVPPQQAPLMNPSMHHMNQMPPSRYNQGGMINAYDWEQANAYDLQYNQGFMPRQSIPFRSNRGGPGPGPGYYNQGMGPNPYPNRSPVAQGNFVPGRPQNRSYGPHTADLYIYPLIIKPEDTQIEEEEAFPIPIPIPTGWAHGITVSPSLRVLFSLVRISAADAGGAVGHQLTGVNQSNHAERTRRHHCAAVWGTGKAQNHVWRCRLGIARFTQYISSQRFRDLVAHPCGLPNRCPHMNRGTVYQTLSSFFSFVAPDTAPVGHCYFQIRSDRVARWIPRREAFGILLYPALRSKLTATCKTTNPTEFLCSSESERVSTRKAAALLVLVGRAAPAPSPQPPAPAPGGRPPSNSSSKANTVQEGSQLPLSDGDDINRSASGNSPPANPFGYGGTPPPTSADDRRKDAFGQRQSISPQPKGPPPLMDEKLLNFDEAGGKDRDAAFRKGAFASGSNAGAFDAEVLRAIMEQAEFRQAFNEAGGLDEDSPQRCHPDGLDSAAAREYVRELISWQKMPKSLAPFVGRARQGAGAGTGSAARKELSESFLDGGALAAPGIESVSLTEKFTPATLEEVGRELSEQSVSSSTAEVAASGGAEGVVRRRLAEASATAASLLLVYDEHKHRAQLQEQNEGRGSARDRETFLANRFQDLKYDRLQGLSKYLGIPCADAEGVYRAVSGIGALLLFNSLPLSILRKCCRDLGINTAEDASMDVNLLPETLAEKISAHLCPSPDGDRLSLSHLVFIPRLQVHECAAGSYICSIDNAKSLGQLPLERYSSNRFSCNKIKWRCMLQARGGFLHLYLWHRYSYPLSVHVLIRTAEAKKKRRNGSSGAEQQETPTPPPSSEAVAEPNELVGVSNFVSLQDALNAPTTSPHGLRTFNAAEGRLVFQLSLSISLSNGSFGEMLNQKEVFDYAPADTRSEPLTTTLEDRRQMERRSAIAAMNTQEEQAREVVRSQWHAGFRQLQYAEYREGQRARQITRERERKQRLLKAGPSPELLREVERYRQTLQNTQQQVAKLQKDKAAEKKEAGRLAARVAEGRTELERLRRIQDEKTAELLKLEEDVRAAQNRIAEKRRRLELRQQRREARQWQQDAKSEAEQPHDALSINDFGLFLNNPGPSTEPVFHTSPQPNEHHQESFSFSTGQPGSSDRMAPVFSTQPNLRSFMGGGGARGGPATAPHAHPPPPPQHPPALYLSHDGERRRERGRQRRRERRSDRCLRLHEPVAVQYKPCDAHVPLRPPRPHAPSAGVPHKPLRQRYGRRAARGRRHPPQPVVNAFTVTAGVPSAAIPFSAFQPETLYVAPTERSTPPAGTQHPFYPETMSHALDAPTPLKDGRKEKEEEKRRKVKKSALHSPAACGKVSAVEAEEEEGESGRRRRGEKVTRTTYPTERETQAHTQAREELHVRILISFRAGAGASDGSGHWLGGPATGKGGKGVQLEKDEEKVLLSQRAYQQRRMRPSRNDGSAEYFVCLFVSVSVAFFSFLFLFFFFFFPPFLFRSSILCCSAGYLSHGDGSAPHSLAAPSRVGLCFSCCAASLHLFFLFTSLFLFLDSLTCGAHILSFQSPLSDSIDLIMSLLGRLLYLALQSAAHVAFYTLPRCVAALWNAPRHLLSSGLAGSPSRASRATVVMTATNDTVLGRFGLDTAADPSGVRVLAQPYRAPLYNCHFNTLLGAVQPVVRHPAMVREVVTAYDGNRVCLDWVYPAHIPLHRVRAVLLCLPGITGNSDAAYIQRVLEPLMALGVAVVVLNPRGVIGTPLDVPRLYCALFTEDIRYAMMHPLQQERLAQRFHREVGQPPLPVLACGFSMGGLILSHYLIEQGQAGKPTGLSAAFTVTSPFNVFVGDKSMNSKLINRILYNIPFSIMIRRTLRPHIPVLLKMPGVDTERVFVGSPTERPLLDGIRSVRDFDSIVTGPHFGFKDADSYYRSVNVMDRLEKAEVPMLCLSSVDDPVCGAPVLAEYERVAAQHPAGLVLLQFPCGGHLGFLQGPWDTFRGVPNPMEEVLLHASITVRQGLTSIDQSSQAAKIRPIFFLIFSHPAVAACCSSYFLISSFILFYFEFYLSCAPISLYWRHDRLLFASFENIFIFIVLRLGLPRIVCPTFHIKNICLSLLALRNCLSCYLTAIQHHCARHARSGELLVVAAKSEYIIIINQIFSFPFYCESFVYFGSREQLQCASACASTSCVSCRKLYRRGSTTPPPCRWSSAPTRREEIISIATQHCYAEQMSCRYFTLKAFYFVIHVLVHLFGYVIPRGLRLLWRLLTMKSCRRRWAHSYIYRPEDEVRVVHNREMTEVVEDIFGLVDVKEDPKEDRQYCCETEEEKKELKARAAECMLFFEGPFYNAHLSTIMGAKRPTQKVVYSRENTHSWDGCPIALDWLYVKGTRPLRQHHSCAMTSKPPSTDLDSPDPEQLHTTTTIDERDPYNEESHPYLPRFSPALSPQTQGPLVSTTPFGSSDEVGELGSNASEPIGSRRFSIESDVKGIVVISPGVTSDSQTGYIRRIVTALHDQEYHVCVINTRGFGGPPASKPFLVNSAYTRDYRTVVQKFFNKEAIKHRFGCALPVIGMGLSNGGATISKYLGECGRDGTEPHLDAAITCCAPNDFVHVVEHMNRGTMQKLVYQPDMCDDVRQYIERHDRFREIPNIDRDYVFTKGNIKRFTRIIHFDEHIFCKTSGYRSPHQYHLDASPILWLPYTPIPTLVLSSFDDPVIGRTVMPHRWREICANNPRLVSVEVRQGGHLGFLQGPIDELLGRPDWMQRFVTQRLDAVCRYWRHTQEHPECSTGMIQLVQETWDAYYKGVQCHCLPSALPSPSDHMYPINSPYFTNRTTRPLPKDCLFRPYFDAPANRQGDETVAAASKRLSVASDTREASNTMDVMVKEEITKFNEKARPIAEVLRTASRMPILTNCDYYVDPRLIRQQLSPCILLLVVCYIKKRKGNKKWEEINNNNKTFRDRKALPIKGKLQRRCFSRQISAVVLQRMTKRFVSPRAAFSLGSFAHPHHCHLQLALGAFAMSAPTGPPSQLPADAVLPLTAAALRDLPDSHVLPYLFAASRQMRCAAVGAHVDGAFVSELLTPRFAASPLPDVVQMTACVLCDVIRVSQSGDSLALPFPSSKCAHVLQCLTRPLAAAVRGGDVARRCAYVVERASASGVLRMLLPRCAPDQVAPLVAALFDSLSAAGEAEGGQQAFAQELGRLLADVIHLQDDVSSAQLSLLLSEAVKGSCLCRKGAPLSIGTIAAGRVLVECLDTLRGPLTEMVLGQVTEAMTTVAEHHEQRREALSSISIALQRLVAATELHVDYVAVLLPRLTTLLDHDSTDIRQLLLRGLATAYTCRPDVILSYRSSFDQFLSHVSDVKPSIRVEMVQSVGKIVHRAKTVWGEAAFPLEQIWPSLYTELEQRLLDPQPPVRREALTAVADAVAIAPELASTVDLETSLGLRAADKHPKVREAALAKLSCLYRSAPERFRWVPSCVLLATNAEDGARAVEAVLESMLPPPCDSGKVTSSRTLDEPLFEFERVPSTNGEGAAWRRYADAWAQLCEDLSEAGFKDLLRLVQRKSAMRAAITKLYQLRQELAEGESAAAEKKSATVHSIHRLLHFLETNTGATKGEWDSLFRCKDARVAQALVRYCADANVDWADEREKLQQTFKGRVDPDVYAFVSTRLAVALAFPMQSRHVQELVRLRKANPARELGTVRALHVFLIAHPACVRLTAPALADAFAALVVANPERTTAQLIRVASDLLLALKEVPEAVRRAAVKEAVLQPSQRDTLLSGLTQLSAGRSALLVHIAASDMDAVAALSKRAAACLVAVTALPGSAGKVKAVESLLQAASHTVRKGCVPRGLVEMVAALQTVRVLGEKLEKRDEALQSAAGVLLYTTDGARWSKAAGGRAAAALLAQQTGVVADSAAKAVAAVALSAPAAQRPKLVESAVDVLLRAQEKVAESTLQAPAAVQTGRCVRLAVLQQLVKLLRVPSSNVEQEVRAAAVLSAEADPMLRRLLQTKLMTHIRRLSCDMRYVALLLLFAIGASSKNEYAELRATVQKVGDHLRKKQCADGGVSLSAPRALGCYLEYAIPFAVLFMAHHPAYEEQESVHFYAFQRVWHLVLEELLRHGIQGVAFLKDLLLRIKNSKDVLQPEASRVRTLADIGLTILQHLLANFELSAADLKRYPGVILVPNFFIPSNDTSGSRSELEAPSALHVPSHVPFRPPQQTSPTPSPRTSPSRTGTPPPPSRRPHTPTGQKRQRTESPQSPRADSEPRQRRTQPMPVELSTSLADLEKEPLSAVEDTVRELTAGLSKQQIAQIRWKEIRSRVEKTAKLIPPDASAVRLDDMLTFAKNKLRERFAAAPEA